MHSVARRRALALYFDVFCGAKLLEGNSKNLYATEAAASSTSGRWLGVDWGTKHIGFALSDETGVSVRLLPHLERTSWKKTVKLIADLCAQHSVHGIVLGFPLRLDGTEGTATQEVRRIARNLALTLNTKVYLQDERFTSSEAEEILRAAKINDSEINRHIHSQAAVIILQNFLSDITYSELVKEYY